MAASKKLKVALGATVAALFFASLTCAVLVLIKGSNGRLDVDAIDARADEILAFEPKMEAYLNSEALIASKDEAGEGGLVDTRPNADLVDEKALISLMEDGRALIALKEQSAALEDLLQKCELAECDAVKADGGYAKIAEALGEVQQIYAWLQPTAVVSDAELEAAKASDNLLLAEMANDLLSVRVELRDFASKYPAEERLDAKGREAMVVEYGEIERHADEIEQKYAEKDLDDFLGDDLSREEIMDYFQKIKNLKRAIKE